MAGTPLFFAFFTKISSVTNIRIIFSHTQDVQVRLGPSILYQKFGNRLLHKTNTIDEIQGLEALELSIKIELDRGLRPLPRSIYSHHFRLDPDIIKDLSTETKKEWLLLIRSAREAHMDAPIDAFSHNDILREWIGLDPISRTQSLTPLVQ